MKSALGSLIEGVSCTQGPSLWFWFFLLLLFLGRCRRTLRLLFSRGWAGRLPGFGLGWLLTLGRFWRLSGPFRIPRGRFRPRWRRSTLGLTWRRLNCFPRRFSGSCQRRSRRTFLRRSRTIRLSVRRRLSHRPRLFCFPHRFGRFGRRRRGRAFCWGLNMTRLSVRRHRSRSCS